MSTYSSRIIKGGALLDDTRRFVEACQDDLDGLGGGHPPLPVGQLGKSSSRREDVSDVLRQRYLRDGPTVLRALRALLPDWRAFREACYYETARTDRLLADFAAGPLYERYWQHARPDLDVGDVVAWLEHHPRVPAWSDNTRLRVAQGILSSLRDFGILEGARKGRGKRILPPHLSIRGFAYVALRERARLTSDRAVLESACWRWYLLDGDQVRRLFIDADRHGILRYQEAGSVVRVDWVIRDLGEVGHVPVA